LIRTRWEKQLKNTLKWLNRQGKIFLGKLTTLADLCLKCCTERQKLKNNISGRKFAEHRGLEDAERIDNDPPFIIFQQKE
jgi:hypothetical protein